MTSWQSKWDDLDDPLHGPDGEPRRAVRVGDVIEAGALLVRVNALRNREDGVTEITDSTLLSIDPSRMERVVVQDEDRRPAL